jgi:amino acid adenylation domain-containing protein
MLPADPSPRRVTLTGLFASSVRQFADRPAASDDEQTLSYAELDRRSSELAAQLYARGVQAEDRVGLYLDRSVDVFVAIVAILKAGAAYVAVDTRYPDPRRDLMFTHSGAKLVVTRPEWRPRLAHLDVNVLEFRSAPSVDDQPPFDTAVAPDQAASVLFTSGSSGAPKAIVLEHRNVVSFAVNRSLPTLTPADRTGQISSLSFDAFHFEMWTTLARGAEIVVLPAVPELLAAGFRAELARRAITAMLVPTMVVNHVVREDRDAFAPLRILQAGGDVLLPSACRDLLDGRFAGELYNLYGPAEITTACTVQRVTEVEARLDSVPIGHALDGVTIHLLSPERQPVRPGDVGEIYVGGPGVARGYLDAPDLTDERFVASPFPTGPTRLYRTGDVARERPDGGLEFIGRVDNQVKVHGYRVEPGEVESALRRHPQIHDAVVLPCGEGTDRRLVSFVVLDGALTLKEVRGYAEATLPEYLAPSRYVALPEIPATEHGKRDMAALQELLDAHQRRHEGYSAPVTEAECYLAGVWEELLGVDRVGGTDHFFDLGGHSLLAFRVQNRVTRDLDVVLDYHTILDTPILADLAAEIDRSRTAGTDR